MEFAVKAQRRPDGKYDVKIADSEYVIDEITEIGDLIAEYIKEHPDRD